MNRLQTCLATNIKKYRKKKNFSQEQLAKVANVSTNYIGLIECGKNYPSLKMLDKIADALEVESIDLFDKEELFYHENENLKNDLQLRIQKAIEKAFESKKGNANKFLDS